MKRKWEGVDTKSAAGQLGISAKTLRKRATEGELKCGVHWVSVSGRNASRRTYRWNVDAILKLWGEV